MTSAASFSTQYIEDEDGQLVEASIIQLVEEDEDGLPTITGATSLDANKAMVLNEATGEVEVIDLADPTVSHEVEVVTVDSDRLFGARRLGNQMRFKNAPALLRNSRRVNNPGFHVQEVPQIQQVIMAPATLPPASASFMKSVRQMSSNTPIVNTSHPHTSRLPNNNFNVNNINIIQPSAITSSSDGREQQFVILSDGGVPLANTEYSIVQDEDLQERLRELLMQQQDVKPNVMEITGSDQQTIYICDNGGQEDGVEVAEIMEEIDGTFVQSGGGNLIYHLDDAGNIVSVSGLGGADNSATVVLEHSVPAPTKKRGRKSATVLDHSKISQKKRAQTELKCLEPECLAVCYNVGELRKHLTSLHDYHFDEETVIFGSEDAFKGWRESYERERMVSFIYRGGTKKIAKDQAVTYLICHRSGHYKPTMGDISKRKRKMKPQGSCKMGGYCTAGIKLLKNLESGEVKMDICHTHYGHPLDNQAIPHLRVNPMLRNVILNKFKDGMSFNEVLEFIHHNPDGLEGLRLVDRRAVRNIFDQWKNPRRRSKSKPSNEITLEEAEPMELAPTGACTSILPDDEDDDDKDPESNDNEVSSDANADSGNEDEESPQITLKIVSSSDSENILSKTDKSEKSEKLTDRTSDEEEENEIEEKDPFDITIVKEELMEQKPDIPPMSPSKSNYTLRPKKRQSLAHLLKPKRYRKSSPSGEEDKEKESSVTAPEAEVSDVPEVPGNSEEVREKEKEKTPTPSSSSSVKKPNRKKKPNLDIVKKDLSESVSEIIDMVVKNPKDFDSSKDTPSKKRKSVREMDLSDDEPDPNIFNNIEQCIEKLYKHGESGPSVLMYKKEGKIAPVYGDITKGFRETDRCIVLQTPVQRQLMQLFPHIIGVEVIEGKSTDMKLIFVMVIDDYREAIPVAWMVSDVIEQRVVVNFFRCLRNECGEISAEFLMAPKNSDFHRLWCMTFSYKPKYIQNEYDARKDLRVTVQQNFTSEDIKKRVWTFVEALLTEKSMTRFNNQLERVEPFFRTLNSPNSEIFLKQFQKLWIETPEEWAFVYRVATPVNTIFAADSFAKLKKFISFKGTKRLRYSVDHILKIGYDKCFLRSKRMFKGDQKHSQHLEEIRRRHFLTGSWKLDYLRLADDNFNWYVTLPEKDRVLVTDVRSPCLCKTTCSECGICMHMYLCSCPDFRLQKIMCEHIHFVHTMRNGDIETETDSDSQATEIRIISTTSELPSSSTFTVYDPDGKISVSSDSAETEPGELTLASITSDLPNTAILTDGVDGKVSASPNKVVSESTSDNLDADLPDTSTLVTHEENDETLTLSELQSESEKIDDTSNTTVTTQVEPEKGESTSTSVVEPEMGNGDESDDDVEKAISAELSAMEADDDDKMPILEPESENFRIASEDLTDSATSTNNKNDSIETPLIDTNFPAASTSNKTEEDKVTPIKKEPENVKPATRNTLKRKLDAPSLTPQIKAVSKHNTRNSTNKKVEPVETNTRNSSSKKVESVETNTSTRNSSTKKAESSEKRNSRSLRSRDSKTPIPIPSPRPQRSIRRVPDKFK